MRKFIIVLLSLQLAFFSPFASAYFDIEKYKRNSNVKSGSKSAFGYSVMNAADGKPYLWSGLKRQATPSTLSKLYKFGGATVAFSAAVYGILGAVDWVMDPDNNRIKYTSQEPQDLPNYTLQAYFVACDSTGTVKYDTHGTVAAALASPDFVDCMATNYLGKNSTYPSCTLGGPHTVVETAQATNPPDPAKTFLFATASAQRINCSRTDEIQNIKIRAIPDLTVGEFEERYLGFEEIAAEVIEAADASDLDAQEDTNKANDPETWVRAGVSDPNGDPEPELKINEKPFECHVRNETSDDSCFKIGGLPEEDENINKPDDEGDLEPAGKVELPAFCTWAKPACNFFVNSLTQSRAFFADARGYFEEVTAAIDETKTPVESDTQFKEVETVDPEPEPELPIVTPITFSTPSACPANPKINFSLGRVNSQIDIPVHLACYVLELLRPFVIAGGYLTGAAILFKGRDS